MPAHLRNITKKCEHAQCSSVATYALCNTWNAILGYYCAKHSTSELDDALARESLDKR